MPGGRPRSAATVPGRFSRFAVGSEPGPAAGAGPAPPSLPPALPPSLPARWPPGLAPHAGRDTSRRAEPATATAAPSRLPRARPGGSRRRPRRDGRWLDGRMERGREGRQRAAGGAAPGRVRTAPSGGRCCSACTPARAPAGGGGGAPGPGRHVTLQRRRVGGGEGGARRACARRWRGPGRRGPGST